MFTGIVEEKGTVQRIIKGSKTCKIVIKADKVLGNGDAVPTAIGDSISVNGICLTVTELGSGSFTADVMPETVRRTSLSGATSGTPVNLERAMPAYGRFGGHIVSGHIDGTGVVKERTDDGNAVWFTISAGPDILKLIVEKGSIAIDGISLTVASVLESSFKVSIIPHTMAETTLLERKPGDKVNLENDIIGKYVNRLIGGNSGKIVFAGDDDISGKAEDLSLLELL